MLHNLIRPHVSVVILMNDALMTYAMILSNWSSPYISAIEHIKRSLKRWIFLSSHDPKVQLNAGTYAGRLRHWETSISTTLAKHKRIYGSGHFMIPHCCHVCWKNTFFVSILLVYMMLFCYSCNYYLVETKLNILQSIWCQPAHG